MTSLANAKPLLADFNISDEAESYPHVFSREQDRSRLEVYDDVLDPHVNDGMEGYLLVIAGEPVIRIGDRICSAKAGDLFHFKISEIHGIESNGDGSRVMVYHGQVSS